MKLRIFLKKDNRVSFLLATAKPNAAGKWKNDQYISTVEYGLIERKYITEFDIVEEKKEI